MTSMYRPTERGAGDADLLLAPAGSLVGGVAFVVLGLLILRPGNNSGDEPR
jgi:hypothetical protein